jgi:hypothetical protein
MNRTTASTIPKLALLALGFLALLGPAAADDWTKIETWYGFDSNDGATAMTSHDKGRNWYGQDCNSLGCRFYHYVRKCDWCRCTAYPADGNIVHNMVCHSDSPFSAMQCD